MEKRNQVLQGHAGDFPHEPRMRKAFLTRTQNPEATKERQRLINSNKNLQKLIKINKFCRAKRKKNYKKSQKANAKLRKIFAIHVTKQGLVPLTEFFKMQIIIHQENGQKTQADNPHTKEYKWLLNIRKDVQQLQSNKRNTN